jgi:hypothetical protein
MVGADDNVHLRALKIIAADHGQKTVAWNPLPARASNYRIGDIAPRPEPAPIKGSFQKAQKECRV